MILYCYFLSFLILNLFLVKINFLETFECIEIWNQLLLKKCQKRNNFIANIFLQFKCISLSKSQLSLKILMNYKWKSFYFTSLIETILQHHFKVVEEKRGEGNLLLVDSVAFPTGIPFRKVNQKAYFRISHNFPPN